MKEDTKQWMLGVITGVTITTLIAIGISQMNRQQNPATYVDMPKDIIQAYNTGIKDALRTNPASSDLEDACLALWAKKQ
jgi:predicted GNAT family acetyltransferase